LKGGVTLISELIEKFNSILFYFIIVKRFLVNFVWRSIFWKIRWIYGYLYL